MGAESILCRLPGSCSILWPTLVPVCFPGINDYTIPCSLDGGWVRQTFLSVPSLYSSFFPSSGLASVRPLGESLGPLTCGLSAQPSTLPIWNIHPSFIDFADQSATTSLSRRSSATLLQLVSRIFGDSFLQRLQNVRPDGHLFLYKVLEMLPSIGRIHNALSVQHLTPPSYTLRSGNQEVVSEFGRIETALFLPFLLAYTKCIK